MNVSKLCAKMLLCNRAGMFGRKTLVRAFGGSSKELIEFAFQNKDGSLTPVQVEKGTTILEVAHGNGIDLEGACEASLACR